ncbi:MAG: DUF6986 family protein [Streptosporangiaceae bacterium]
MKLSLDPGDLDALILRIERARASHARLYPGRQDVRQPVHTVCVPADRFTAATARNWGDQARRLLDDHAPDAATLGAAIGTGDQALVPVVRERVADKLAREPVEDIRVDFEDGYGERGDAEEDDEVERVVGEVAAARDSGALPPFWGVRIKSYAGGRHDRSIRTLDLFLTGLLERCEGRLPEGFVVTFPKVVMPEHVAVFAEVLARLEATLGLPEGALRFEIQVETPESIVNHHGEVGLRRIVDAAGPRLRSACFGVHDYTAACGLPPEAQRLTHPACDVARHIMQVTLAGTDVLLSDGSTNVVPDGPGNAGWDADGDAGWDADGEARGNAVNAVWRVHAAHVRHSLRHGFYQGWDVHPSHLPARFGVVYAFHLAGLDQAAARIRAWREGGGRAQGFGAAAGILDEPATIAATLAKLRRAVDCGAVSEAEVRDRTGLPSLKSVELP